MNCRKRMAPGKAGASQVKKNPSRKGNGTKSHSDTHGMERHAMPLPPKDKTGRVADWS